MKLDIQHNDKKLSVDLGDEFDLPGSRTEPDPGTADLGVCQIRETCDGAPSGQSVDMPLAEGVTIHDVIACPECRTFLEENAPEEP